MNRSQKLRSLKLANQLKERVKMGRSSELSDRNELEGVNTWANCDLCGTWRKVTNLFRVIPMSMAKVSDLFGLTA